MIETAPHEFAAHFLFDEFGLDPFFACNRRVKDGDGSVEAKFECDGETWVARLSYRGSGLEHPGDRLPGGTEFLLEEMREFDMHIESDDDPLGERSAHIHIMPRWQGMRSESGQDIPVPPDIDEAVNLHVQGSNIEFEEYQTLIRKAMSAVGVDGYYFRSLHEFSTVLDAERYVRIQESVSGKVHARDGPIAQLGHLLEHDRTGRRKLVQFDSDERGRDQPGYYHTATLGPRRIQEAFPSHELPKEVKHYYAQEAAGMSSDRELAHPKVGVSYQKSFWKDKLDPSVEGLDQLTCEIEETLLSVLAEAGIPLRPGSGSYVEDAYFEPVESERARTLVELDFTQIKHRQESVVIKHIADGIAPTAWDALEVLVTDGGEVSPKDIAEEKDRHPSSVRRALNRIPELVEREYGSVSLRSDYIAELVHDAVSEAREATRRAAEAGAKAIEAAERGLDEGTSAFIAWAAKHDIDVTDYDDVELRLDFGSVDDIRRKLREGFELWRHADLPESRYRMAKVRYEKKVSSDLRSVDTSETKSYATTAWHYLD
nr:MarR family transcriptional regulator [Haloarchaeobius litoreus]